MLVTLTLAMICREPRSVATKRCARPVTARRPARPRRTSTSSCGVKKSGDRGPAPTARGASRCAVVGQQRVDVLGADRRDRKPRRRHRDGRKTGQLAHLRVAVTGRRSCEVSSSTRARSSRRCARRASPYRRSASPMIVPTSRASASPKPRDVIAGEPMRMPLVTIGFCWSNGIAFLFTVTAISSRYDFDRFAGEILRAQVDQQQMRVGSAGNEPHPGALQFLAHRARVDQHRLLVGAETPAAAPLGRPRLWPRSCASAGRPGSPGRRSCRSPRPALRSVRMNPPRGPRSVLCVVEVTNSASGTGEGCRPTATRPAMCAMSTIKTAPISSAISRNGS